MEITIREGSQKAVIDKNSIFSLHELNDQKIIIKWDRCNQNNFSDENLQDLVRSFRNSKTLPLDHCLETGVYLVSLPDEGIILYSDPGIPTSLYYSVKGGTVYLAGTDKKVSDLISSSPEIDYAGVYQRLIFGYPFGSRTRYKDIYVLEPGSAVFIDLKGNINRKLLYYEHIGTTLQDIWGALKEEVGKIRDEKTGIMLSAGYDSRLLLAVCMDQKKRIDLAYTHGLIGSNELNIAYELAKIAGARTVVHMDAGSEMFGSAEELHAFFNDIGMLYQVFWRLAGKYFAAEGVTPICGIQAEILNGQFMNGLRMSSLSRMKKYVIGNHGYNAYINSNKSFSDFFLNSVNTDFLNFIRPNLMGRFKEAREVTRHDLQSLAESYKSVCDNWDDIVIRFLSDHDGSKLMAQQARILQRFCHASAPFTSRKVYLLCNNYPAKDKLYGKAMRKLICKYSPRLSKYQCTKSNLPLFFPDVAHLVGRALRSYSDNGKIIRFLKSRGEKRRYLEKLSWIGGDLWIRDSNSLEEILKLVTWDILDPKITNDFINRVSNYTIAVGDGNDLLRLIELELLYGEQQ
ncbi:MAG: hypothetical protein ACOX2W_15700 [Desulfomonilia bacterium]|jgi:hypothetical protein|nr:hypothetical protein [Bacteroidales bacterium]